MPGHAGNIDDGAFILLLHHRKHGLHRGNRAEEIGFEHVAQGIHIDLRHRIDKAVTSIVDPDVDAFEVVNCEVHHPVDFFAMTNVAR